ncbi:hypothetical protein, variant 2 [Aphanomyces invadans]|uniref:Peptidase S54 rhomboid domain-containing protein n=1 Tax=Aphanomyces invadans TaxID=157072 RepID=A0A024URM5_9STRA|nr:hypothetical protein, variant 1 [Aphanomyces invadans]XP_008862909.1 hypothetical protein, variant 2 [Aphanomyces invadans]ETW09100.1 hypothetical protein, variant 1 [Aphanomyces invadans]ETW09101.1 hypothetical protein, variant 2 [Aphanomyces invadans]|eukprot:XP_008862908.1 hypothetical protein, variant 1 [Aphanomyces invadans]
MALEDFRFPATVFFATLIPVLWILGALLTPEKQHGVFALSIASVILEHIRPWAYITAPFYHQHLWEVVLIVPATLYLGSRVEIALGTMSFVRLVCFVGVVSTGLLFCDMFALYIVFRNAFFLRTGVSGFTGGLVAMLVALVKENPVQALVIPKVPCRYYPLMLTVLCLAMSIGAVLTKAEILIVGAGPYAVSGLYFGWFYLRFIAKNADGSKGDTSEAFSLTVLFPSFLKPSLAPIFDFFFNVAKLCGLFKYRDAQAAAASLVCYSSTLHVHHI